MKTAIHNTKNTIYLLTLILVLSPMFGGIFGQESCPAIVRATVSAEGCTKKSARDNLTAKIATVGTTTCTALVCDPPTPSCIVNHVILIGKRATCTRVPDSDDECHGPKKWVCTRDVDFDCQCFGDDGTSESRSGNMTNSIIDKLTEEKTFVLFPNPAALQLNMEITGYEGRTELILFDLRGQVMISKNLQLQGQDMHTINISSLPKGMYMISLSDDTTMTTMSFTKE